MLATVPLWSTQSTISGIAEMDAKHDALKTLGALAATG